MRRAFLTTRTNGQDICAAVLSLSLYHRTSTCPHLTACSTDQYIWMRGNHLISDITSNQWRINTVKLEDATTFSCTVGNEAGSTPEGKVNLTVFSK